MLQMNALEASCTIDEHRLCCRETILQRRRDEYRDMVPQFFDMVGCENLRSDDEATAMRQVGICLHSISMPWNASQTRGSVTCFLVDGLRRGLQPWRRAAWHGPGFTALFGLGWNGLRKNVGPVCVLAPHGIPCQLSQKQPEDLRQRAPSSGIPAIA